MIRAMGQFQATVTRYGDFFVSGGQVIPTRSGQAPFLVADMSSGDAPPAYVDPQGNRTYSAAGPSVFVGGSGRNAIVTGQPGTNVPAGFFTGNGSEDFSGVIFGGSMLTIRGDGSADLFDGTGSLASVPAGFATGVPTAPFALPASPYGETTYNSGSPFSLTVVRESDSYALLPADMTHTAGATIAGMAQEFTPSDTSHYAGAVDATWTITVNSYGLAYIQDGTDIVATRADGPINDAGGRYESTGYGQFTYNDDIPFAGIVSIRISQPIAGYIYVVVVESAPGVVGSVKGPYRATSLPAPTSTDFPVPVAYSDGYGAITQYLDGPIYWS